MNERSKFKRNKWADGRPSIEIEPFEYSKAGFDRLLSALAWFAPALVNLETGVDELMADLTIGTERVEIHMDNHYFSVAFKTESLRDDVLRRLKGED